MINFYKILIIINLLILLNKVFVRLLSKKIYFLLLLFSIIIFFNFTFKNYFINVSNVEVGISRASFLGVNPTAVKSMLILMVFIIFVSAILIIKVFSQSNFFSTTVNINFKYQIPSIPELILICILTLISVLFLIPQRLNQIENWKADLLAWDLQNFETWSGLFLNGFVPMRDFWYPYGNLIYLHAYPLKGLIFTAIINFSVFIYIYRFSIIFKSSVLIRLIFYFIFFNLMIIFHIQNNFLVIPRYIVVSFGIALLSTLILYNLKLNLLDLFLCTLPMIFAFYYSILFCIVTVIIIITKVINNYFTHKQNFKSSFKILNNFFVILPFLITFLYLIILFKNDSIFNELDLLTSQKYEEGLSYPMNMTDKFNEDRITFFYTIFIFIIFLFYLLIFMIKFRGENENFNYIQIILLSIVIYFYLSLQKFSIRGPIEDSWMIAIVLSTIFIIAYNKSIFQRKNFELLSLVILSTTLIWTILYFKNNFNLNQVANYKVVNQLINDKEIIVRKYKDINNYHIKKSWVETLNFFNKNKSERFFTLTDNGYLYLASGQLPYFHIAAHEMSNKFDDEKLQTLLKTDVPSFVVIDLHTFNFEGLNSQFRLPKTTQWVVQNYKYVINFDDIYIFKYDIKNERKIDKLFFKLFERNNLGKIPELITQKGKVDCLILEFDCKSILKVYLNKNLSFDECKVIFTIENSQSIFQLKISKEFNRTSIYLPIYNFWFYPQKIDSIEYSKCISRIEMQSIKTKSFY